MSIAPGDHLGPYKIIDKLGEGGMGQVFRARDTRLNRDVALKILPELFALDPERRARFDREARTLAALNHPHIAQIYGLEQSGATSALVMELIDGEDLAQRIARGPIPVDEAIAIAKQIAWRPRARRCRCWRMLRCSAQRGLASDSSGSRSPALTPSVRSRTSTEADRPRSWVG